MPAVYLGGFTIGGTIPGASAVLEQVGSALLFLRDTVEAQVGALQDIQATLQAQVDALGAAKDAIRIPAVADLESLLAAAEDLLAGFEEQAGDPLAYLQGLLAGLQQVQANLQALVPPSLAITGQIAAMAAQVADLISKIAAIDGQLAALDVIAQALFGAAAAVQSILSALTGALAAVAGALQSYIELTGRLSATGAHCFVFEGQLGDLGSSLDAVTPGSGLGPTDPIRAPIIVVSAVDTAANEGLEAVFRLS